MLLIVDTKKISDWSSTTNSMKSSYIQENNDQCEIIPSGPIDLNQLLKSKNDTYLKQHFNSKCFPIIMMTPGFDDNAFVEQEENAPFNIIAMPITMNETNENDVCK